MSAIARDTEVITASVSKQIKQSLIESAERNHRSIGREVEHVLSLAYSNKQQIELR